MNAPVRKFEARPAVRESVPLLVGIMGPSGAGKSYSALRLGTGIQEVTGGDLYAIDTEARRLLHYADNFKFKHVEFNAPFGSLDYLAAIQHCVAQGAKVIIIDSMTHEHSGPGGYLLTHEAEVERMAGNDYAKRERVKMAGWIKPSALRGQMISGILQLNVNLIFCFRAKEKTKPVKGGGIQELGFMPIAGEELLFEQTVNCLLLPKSGGVPTWRSDQVGEKMMMKLPRQFETIFADQKPLDETIGRALAAWARGDQPSARGDVAATEPAPARAPQPKAGAGEATTEPTYDEIMTYDNLLTEAAKLGGEQLKSTWKNVPRKIQPSLKSALDNRHKVAAAEADKQAETTGMQGTAR